MTKIDKTSFQNDLVRWFESEHRDLPWRKDRDPYKIWVSEVMLQQTRVDTVIPYFERFINRFPTVEALAKADEEEVLKLWEGLGYYSRARNLHAGVRQVYEMYGGRIPDNKRDISALRSVGPYTAGAILSIAFGQPEPAVDGNVMRVLSRVLFIEDDIAKASTRKRFESIVQELIPRGRTSAFNQGLMELGAVICTPKAPKCLLCPVKEHCGAFAKGKQEELPVKSRKKPPKVVPMTVAVVKNETGDVLIRRRPQEGLLAGLWEFPGFETSRVEDVPDLMKRSYGANIRLIRHMCDIRHVFTHLKWEMAVHEGIALTSVPRSEDVRFVSVKDLDKYAFSVSHQKIIQRLKEEPSTWT